MSMGSQQQPGAPYGQGQPVRQAQQAGQGWTPDGQGGAAPAQQGYQQQGYAPQPAQPGYPPNAQPAQPYPAQPGQPYPGQQGQQGQPGQPGQPGQFGQQPGFQPGHPAPGMPAAAPPGGAAAAAVGLTKIYGSGETIVRALDNVSVQIGARQFTAIMGPSGSGKSTLMHCLAGLDAATSGSVFLGGTEISRLSDRQLTILRRDRVGFVFQAFNLLPTLTAEQNIALPSELAGKKPDREWIGRLVQVLGIADRMGHRPSEMSGGQQQRVAVARALSTRPDVVFADEPTGNLDSRSGAEVLSFLRSSVREFGQTVVMVTHDPVAASYSDRVVLLADGRPVGEIHQPTPDTVLQAIRGLGG